MSTDLETNLQIIEEFTQRLQVAVIGAEETTAKHVDWVEGPVDGTIQTANGPLKTLRGQIAEWRLAADQDVSSAISGYDTQFAAALAQFQIDFEAYLITIGFEPAVEYLAGINIVRRAQTVVYNGVTYYWTASLPYTTTGNFATEASWQIAPIVGGIEIPGFNFATGGKLLRKNQSVVGLDGEWYYWTGNFPKTIPPASTLESAGGVGENLFKIASGVPPLRPSMKIMLSSIGMHLNSGSFETGATLTNPDEVLCQFLTGKIFKWVGSLPKVVDLFSTPGSSGGVGAGAWVELVVSYSNTMIRESLRRSYAEAGFVLVDGSFDAGGMVTTNADVMLYEADGRAYAWGGAFPVGGKNVPQGSTPDTSGGIGPGAWTDKGQVSLRSILAGPMGYTHVGGVASQADLSSSEGDIAALQSDFVQLQSEVTVIGRTENISMSVIAGKLVAGTSAGTKIHFFGDSTMWGSKPAPDTTLQHPENPPAMFKIALDLIFPGNGVAVTNKAIPGSSLYSMIRGINHYFPNTYEEMLQGDTPTVSYCGHCLNDCSSVDSETNISQYYEDLISFVDITRAYGVIPVLVTPSIHAPLGSGTVAQTKRQITFIQAMRDVAEKKCVDLVDCNEYTRRSLNLWTPMAIAPDGVHLSPMFSSQLGFNMLIPLVRPKILENSGDIAGLSTSIWNDNLPEVFNKVTNSASSRFGPALLGEGGATDLKINFPVILADATKDTFVAFGGSAWDTHGKSSITYFDGYGTTTVIDGDIDASTQVATSDALFAPSHCQLPAGLAIIGVKLPGATQIGKVFTFSGLTLLDKNFSGTGRLSSTGVNQPRPILSGDTVTSAVTLVSGNTLLRFCNADNPASNIIEIKWDSTSGKVVIISPSGTTDLWVSPVANSVFGLEVNFNQRSFTVSLGGLSQTISSLAFSLPKLLVNSVTPYSVTRS